MFRCQKVSAGFFSEISIATLAKYQEHALTKAALNVLPSSGNSDCLSSPVFVGVKVLRPIAILNPVKWVPEKYLHIFCEYTATI